jgi:type IV pilus assembly protein PilC
MAIYLWHAKTRSGQERSGELEVANRDVANATLRRQGFIDIKVKKKPTEIVIFPEKVKEKDITVFFRQLSTMINAGLPLVQCFELAENGSEKKAMIKLLKDVRHELESGNPLGESMRKFPREFDRLTCSLVEAGEQGGILDTILLRLCSYKEKAMALRGKIKSAMVYPISIITVAFIVTAILMIFVIPVFSDMFSSMGAALPVPTQITIAISNAFVKYWYLVLFGPIILVFAIRYIYKTPQGHYQFDKLLLNIPVLGDVLRKGAVARFCRTFSTLVAAGVPILDALDTVAETSGNVVIEGVIRESKESISQGQTLTAPLATSKVFPVMVTQMISIGEQTGTLETMLGKIADFYEEEVDTAVDSMTSLMEPFIMAFLGVVIGGLVISMYLPIFQMAAVVSGS